MTKDKTIAILKGGLSAEHAISNKSAYSVKIALIAKGYNTLKLMLIINFCLGLKKINIE